MKEPQHPGQYVRKELMAPKSISVTEVAKLLDVSRPNVSNFLNGKAATTAEMAMRVERAFGIPAQTLLDMQAAYDAAQAKLKGAPSNARAYVPPFLALHRNDIEGWADKNLSARARLSVFLRTLVNSTGIGLAKVDFPGNDDSERPGWDGVVEASEGTPWIPAGKSGWEFGVSKDIKRKADGDFAKSVKANSKSERDETTFVFVTPRAWKAKEAWASSMRSKKQWKDVRAYDASDLEQWLEQSLAGQVWFANETGVAAKGVRTLEKCWMDWADVATPRLSGALFETAVTAYREKVRSFVDRPVGRPLVVAADSVEEALAFLAHILAEPEFVSTLDRVLVFDRSDALIKLTKGNSDFIAVAHSRDVERELGPHANDLKTIVVYPRNATLDTPDILLEPLRYETICKALKEMGIGDDQAKQLARASGSSLTVLRRLLSKVEAIRQPDWANDGATAACLIPMMFVGAWDADNEADRLALSLIGDTPFEELERRTQEFVSINDAPLWSIGSSRGVVSKIDTLFAIAKTITKPDLDRFLDMAKIVLSEDDPALDLSDSERWRAALNDTRREFSRALRDGISETLVLLSVHGKHLFHQRLGFEGEKAVEHFIHGLLEPLTLRKLEANDSDLTAYAEAAPKAFLSIIEADLRKDEPEVLGLLRPVEAGVFGGTCIRSGLLWALEGLAWSPETFLRSVLILARLSQVEIRDNWANTPIASLMSIFRAWMPQTAADHDARLKAVSMLIARFPEIGWQVCVHQFGHHGNDVGDYSHKPKWRQDGYGFGEPFVYMEPIQKFRVAMVELALNRPSYSLEMLCDLVDRLHGLGEDYQAEVWRLIENWIASGVSEWDIAHLREKVRVTVLSRRGRRRGREGEFAALNKKAKTIYALMEPKDLINKHAWLFLQSWVEESADELNDDELDFQKRDERIAVLRREALKEIYEERGTGGVFELASRGKAQLQIGFHLAKDVLSASQVELFVFKALKNSDSDATRDRRVLIDGAIRALRVQDRLALLNRACETLADIDVLTLLLLSPYDKCTWAAVGKMPVHVREAYWREVRPDFIFEPETDNNASVEHLMAANRPRAAFEAVHLKLEVVKPPLIVDMLSAIARDSDDAPGEYQLREYDIEKAFELVDRNPDLTLEQKAELEFVYIDVLASMYGRESKNRIPNLEKYVEEHPEMYVQALVWAYKRKHGGEDPPEFQKPEKREDLSVKGYRLLESVKHIPGSKDDGSFNQEKLMKWVNQVRKKSTELDRSEVCDICLGRLMSHAPNGDDGVWPCEAIRELFENVQSDSMMRGAHTGLYNQRGVHARAEGGGQERELAAKYQVWADALQYSHPFVSSKLLGRLVSTYEREADGWDSEASIRRRLSR